MIFKLYKYYDELENKYYSNNKKFVRNIIQQANNILRRLW